MGRRQMGKRIIPSRTGRNTDRGSIFSTHILCLTAHHEKRLPITQIACPDVNQENRGGRRGRDMKGKMISVLK